MKFVQSRHDPSRVHLNSCPGVREDKHFLFRVSGKIREDTLVMADFHPDCTPFAGESTLIFEASDPKALFEAHVSAHTMLTGARNYFLAAADGQRFLMANQLEIQQSSPITVVTNWTAALHK